MKRSHFLKKNSKWKSLLFFFFLASLFWLLTKISKEFTAPVTAKIEFINVPETVSIKEKNANEITFNLFTSGYDFFGYKIKQPVLSIDVSKFTNENTSSIIITSGELLKEINEQFPSSRSANTLNLDVLSLIIDPIVRKKIPVVVQKNVSYKNGFRQIGAILALPDSIYISGPQKMVVGIDSITTESIAIKLVDSNVSKKVSILKPKIAGLSLSNETVSVSWVVKEIAQKEFEIPVKVINKPSNETIKIIPSIVRIRVDVTLDHFNEVSAKDFEIICDYKKRNINENYMVAQLKRQSQWSEHTELGTQKIDFLIFKE